MDEMPLNKWTVAYPWLWCLLGLGLMAFGVYFFHSGYHKYRRAVVLLERGTVAEGAVAEAWITRKRQGGRYGDKPRTTYHATIHFTDRRGRDHTFHVTGVPAEWETGRAVEVHYLDDDPAIAGVEQTHTLIPSRAAAGMMAGPFLFLFGVMMGMVGVWKWRHDRRPPVPEKP